MSVTPEFDKKNKTVTISLTMPNRAWSELCFLSAMDGREEDDYLITLICLAHQLWDEQTDLKNWERQEYQKIFSRLTAQYMEVRIAKEERLRDLTGKTDDDD